MGLCLFASAVVVPAKVPAQTNFRLSKHQHQGWQVEGGLPENNVRMIAQGFPKACIVVLSNYQGSEDTYRTVHFGVMAYLTKDASGEELVNAIQSVDLGLRYLPCVPLDRLAERIPSVDLTPRESEVLACVAQAASTVRLPTGSVSRKRRCGFTYLPRSKNGSSPPRAGDDLRSCPSGLKILIHTGG